MQSVKKIISDISSNKTVLLIDDISNCSYLLHPAQSINNENVSFIVNNSKGIVFVAICSDIVKKLGLNFLIKNSTSTLKNMTVSVEARYGVSTGISCADRATTLNVLSNTNDPKQDIVTPGHIFPISSKTGGVLVKASIAEACVDLCKIASQKPLCAFSQCLDKNGEILDIEGSKKLADKINVNFCSISEVVSYRLSKEKIIHKLESQNLNDKEEIKLHTFQSTVDKTSLHLSLIHI